jgi:DinB superfamily
MSANPLSAISEKQALQARLDEGRMLWLGSLKGVSEEDAQFHPGEGAWTILQVAEHVATSERQMLALWTKTATPGSSPREKDAMLIAAQGDRNKKNPAPDRSMPMGRYKSLAEAEAAFLTFREATMTALAGAEGLREKIVNHPLANVVDGYQLFLIMALHPQRHMYQIEDIKNHPAYPRQK